MFCHLPVAEAVAKLTRPHQRDAEAPAGWKKSVAIIKRAMKQSGVPFVEAEGEARELARAWKSKTRPEER